MINASINGVCNKGKPSKVAIQDIMHSTITERNVTMIKGFIMVKGLLACFNKVFEVFKYLWSNSEHFVYFVNYRRKQP